MRPSRTSWRTAVSGAAIAVAWLAPGSAAAQDGTWSVALRDAPVGAALQDLASRTGISLVFDASVVEGRTTVCRLENETAEAILRCIVAGAGLDFYRLSSGTYVVINSPEDLPAWGAISGQVLDDLTGEPLASARVALEDYSVSTFTNSSGLFSLPGLLPGSYRVVVSRAGYQPYTVPLRVEPRGSTRQRIRLDPTVLELDPLVVDGMSEVGGSLSGRRTDRLGDVADGFGDGLDLSARARSGLGVSRRPLFADLSIQGSAPGEHMVRLDGVPVFDPVSLGRTRSAFSPLALRRITVRKAGFGVEHGSFAGGVIDVEHSVSDRGAGHGVTALAEPYSISADASVDLRAFGGEGTFMVAGRTDLWDLYRERSLDQAMRGWNQVDPALMEALSPTSFRFDAAPQPGLGRTGTDLSFGDVHAVLHMDFPGFRTLEASFYRGTNRVGTQSSFSGVWTPPVPGATAGPTELYVMRDRYDWSNTMGQLRTGWLLGDRASLEVRAWGSEHAFEHAYAMAGAPAAGDEAGNRSVIFDLQQRLDALPTPEDGNGVREAGAAVTGDLAAGGGHFLSGGLEGIQVQSQAYLQNSFLRPVQVRADTWRAAAWLNDQWRVSRNLTLDAGVRFTSVEGGEPLAEPRLALRLDGNSGWAGPWSVRLAGGVFRQFLNQYSLANVGPSALVPDVRFWLPVDESIAPARSRHMSAEVALQPWRGWEFRGEAYYKSLDRILALDYSVLAGPTGGAMEEMAMGDLIGPSRGEAYGAGLRAGWESGTARVEAAWDWTVSERDFPSRFGGAPQPTPWVEPHRVLLRTQLPIRGGFSFTAESRNVWGRTWALRRAYYDYLTVTPDAGGLPIGLPGDDPLPSLHHLDLGISWLGRLQGTLAEFRVEVRDAQGTRQVLDYSLAPSQTPQGVEYLRTPRLLPGTALLITARFGL